MGPPYNRAAAPGTQNVRSDNVKGESWVDVRKLPPLRGQIFFVTDEPKPDAVNVLDDHDMEQLDKIVSEYWGKLVRYADLGRKVDFEYNGYADYRYTKEHNYDLSERRANAVAKYLEDKLGAFSSYRATVKGRGIDYNGIDRPPDSKALMQYRRVDIVADSPDLPPPPKPEAPGEQLSQTWKARLVRSFSTGYGVWAGDVFQIEIVDLTNNIAMLFKYVGIGLGASVKGTPGGSADKSAWVNFSTIMKTNVMDFEGGAVHASGQAQVSGGLSSDNVKLYGPEAHRPGDAPINLEWSGWNDWGSKGAGIGVMMSFGGISPDPPQQKPYPAPGD